MQGAVRAAMITMREPDFEEMSPVLPPGASTRRSWAGCRFKNDIANDMQFTGLDHVAAGKSSITPVVAANIVDGSNPPRLFLAVGGHDRSLPARLREIVAHHGGEAV